MAKKKKNGKNRTYQRQQNRNQKGENNDPPRNESEQDKSIATSKVKSDETIEDKSESAGFRAWTDIRETVESIVIAFILAFLIRTFEAEAFSIPTGSMAPTLMGRHKDVDCPVCGHRYQITASSEVDEVGRTNMNRDVVAGECPICRFQIDMQEGNPQGLDYKSYSGDRILVDKLAYKLGDPKRWDVAVFKFPGEAQTNFIKRLVGLPGETITISGGDLFVQKKGENKTTIARKSPKKLRALLRPVFDNDRVTAIVNAGGTVRWKAPEPWETIEEGQAFKIDSDDGQIHWLTYYHTPPLPPDAPQPGRTNEIEPLPYLISDLCQYNTQRSRSYNPLDYKPNIELYKTPEERRFNYRKRYNRLDPDGSEPAEQDPPRTFPRLWIEAGGTHWVGDLAVRTTATINGKEGHLTLELVEGGYRMQCQIDTQTGKASLRIVPPDGSAPEAMTEDGKPYRPTADTNVQGPGTYELMLSNCDDQLLLWVDGDPITFDTSTAYQPIPNRSATPEDLRPVRLGAKDINVTLSHIMIYRDTYYIAINNANRAMMDPDDPDEVISFELSDDEFLALGDNSPRSRDSRLWNSDLPQITPGLRREFLIGKAVFIYWPHSWDRIPGTEIPLKFFPNFGDMDFIH